MEQVSEYTDIKRTSDQLVREDAKKKERERSTIKRKYFEALRIVDHLIKAELQAIGSTFFGKRVGFLLVPRKNYRVIDFRFKSYEVGHIWQLQICDRQPGWNGVVYIRMQHDKEIKFFVCVQGYSAPVCVKKYVVETQWVRVIEELHKAISEINHKLA